MQELTEYTEYYLQATELCIIQGAYHATNYITSNLPWHKQAEKDKKKENKKQKRDLIYYHAGIYRKYTKIRMFYPG